MNFDLNIFLRDLIANINFSLYDITLAIYTFLHSFGIV